MANQVEQRPILDLDLSSSAEGSANQREILDLPYDEEGTLKSIERYGLQVAKAAPYANPITAGYNILSNLAPYSHLTHQMEAAQNLWSAGAINDEQYQEYVKNIQNSMPQIQAQTPSFENIYRKIEETTGLPLEARTTGQKATELVSAGALGAGGGIGTKAASGASTYGLSQILQLIGVPEDVANSISLFVAPYGTSKASQKIQSMNKAGIQATESPNIESAIKTESIPTRSKYDIFKELPEYLKEQSPIPEKEVPPIGYGEREISYPIEEYQGKPIGKAKAIETSIPSAQEKISQLGTEVKPVTSESPIYEQLGSKISKYEARDPTIAGKRLKEIINNKSEQQYSEVNKKYNISRKLNQNIEEPRERLYDELDSELNEKGSLPDFKKDEDVMNKVKKIRDSLGKVDNEYKKELEEAGIDFSPKDVIQFHPISNQELIDLSTNLRDYVQFKFAHDPSNAYYKIIDQIENEIINSSKNHPAALKAYLDAKDSYKNWAQTFNNDYIRQFTNKQNKNYSNLFKEAQNTDHYNQLKEILDNNPSQADKHYEKVLRRKIIEDKLAKYPTSGKLSEALRSGEFEKSLDETGIGLSKEEKDSILNTAKRIASQGIKQKVGKLSKKPKEPSAPKAWWEGKSPEELAQRAENISGVKELERSVKDLKGGPEKIKKLKLDLGLYRLRNGKIRGPESERSYAKVLEDVENRRYLEETLGKDTVDQLDVLTKNLEKTKLLDKNGSPKKGRFTAAIKREALDKVLSTVHLPYEVKRTVIEDLVPRPTGHRE